MDCCPNVGIEKMVETIDSIPRVDWDFEGIHYFDNGPLTVQYLLVLDALNFCFWPGMLFFSFLIFHVDFCSFGGYGLYDSHLWMQMGVQNCLICLFAFVILSSAIRFHQKKKKSVQFVMFLYLINRNYLVK